MGISFPKFVKVVERAKVVCNRFEEQHPMLLHFTSQEIFNIESGSVNEACRRKRVLYLLTNI